MFADFPEESSCQPYEIVRPGPQRPVMGISVTPVFKGVITHWWGGTRYRCLGDPTTCAACDAGQEKRWTGHLPIQLDKNGHRKLVAFTEPCSEPLRLLYTLPNGLLGAKVLFARLGASEQGPMVVRVIETGLDVPSMDVASLERMIRRIYKKTCPVRRRYDVSRPLADEVKKAVSKASGWRWRPS